MQEEKFRDYLRHHHIGKMGSLLDDSTIQSRISNCKTIEAYEGNLDALFARDQLSDLLSRLSYSTADQATGKPLRHKIPIDGDWRNGSATLKSAAELYKAFKSHSTGGASQPKTAAPQAPWAPKEDSSWPEWPRLQNNEELVLARMVATLVRFLRPEIVRAIVEDNERKHAEWSKRRE